MKESTPVQENSVGPLIRAGGVAMVIAFSIHIVANSFLKELPPTDPTLDELRIYLEAENSIWQVVHGMRYLAVAALGIFYAALYSRTRCSTEGLTGGWEIVGLIGGVLHLASLHITNGIETFAFLDFTLLSENPELFWQTYNTTSVLFSAELSVWALMLLGFSMAGWKSRTIPAWIGSIGLFAAAFAIVAGVFVTAAITTDGWAAAVYEIGMLATLAWFFCTGIFMVVRGAN